MTTTPPPVNPSGVPTRTLNTTKKADDACTADVAKGAAMYGAVGAVVGFLGDAILGSTSSSYRVFANRQGKLLIVGAVAAASAAYGGYQANEVCRQMMRNSYKVEGTQTSMRTNSPH